MAMALDGTEEGAVIGGQTINDLRFADDIALLAKQANGLQESLTKVVQVSREMGMSINVLKTESQFLGRGNIKFQLEADGHQLEQTENFVYLGGTISTNGESEKDINRRIGLARGILQVLGKVWSSKEIGKATKVQMYETLVLSALLYNSETWTLREAQKQRLRVFEMACLRKIEGVTRRDRIRNTEIYNRLNIQHDIIHKIQSKRLRYFGHVSRMRDERYPKIAVNGYVHGKRKKGRPKKRWVDMIREDCREMGWSIQEATHKAQEREKWRFSIAGRLSRAKASSKP